MDITIIGTGNMARGIATRALAGGHSVTLLGTEAGKAEALAGELSGDVRTARSATRSTGDVVVLAVWYQALDDVLGRYGDQLAGKVVVDITNPVDPQTYQPLTVEAGSAAQEIAQKASRARRSSRRSTRRSPARSSRARSPASRSTSSSPPTTTTPRRRPRARRGRRHARRRRRPARARPPAGGARLPAHGDPGRARHRLRQRDQGRRIAADSASR